MFETKSIAADSGIDKASGEFLAAGRKYREFLKRNYRDRLHGVIWVQCGHEVVLYCESGKYAQQLQNCTFDESTDSFVSTEIKDGE